jgi:type II secretory pathway component GspD/PulD (secretin)
MRWARYILALVTLAAGVFAADQPHAKTPSKKDLKDAKSAFSRGLKLQNSKHLNEALHEFDSAVQLAPQNTQYLTAREMVRQQLVFEHMERGNASMEHGRQIEALAEFRGAMELDPQNTYARQRLADAAGQSPNQPSALTRILANSGEVQVKPNPITADFHYRGDPRGLLTQVTSTYGISAMLDDSVLSRPVKFDIGNVDFFTAMQASGSVTKTFWVPMGEKQILVAAESAENHRNFDRMVLRTFYIPGLNGAKDLNDLTNLLRNLFDVRFVLAQPGSGTLVIRAPQQTVDAATTFLESLDNSRPQVMLDIRVYEISHTFVRDMGLRLPYQFQMFNIPVGALAALGGQNIQDLINQLIASGGINQANSDAISALLAQLQNQQNSIFSQPLVTFGSGLTFMGLSLGTAAAQLHTNESWVKTLEHAYVRTSQGDDATFKIGTRFPIVNATFAPIFNNPAISQVIQNNSFQAPIPSINYEDIGLNLKAKPVVSGKSDVTLALEMQFRTLLGQQLNGIPVISNREYKGTITLKDGESGVVVGSVSRTDSRSMTGLPGFGSVPVLNKIMTNNNKQEDDDELLMVITPHVISGVAHEQAAETWLKQ